MGNHRGGYEFSGSVRRDAYYLAQNQCEVCGTTEDLVIHHIISIDYARQYYPYLLELGLIRDLCNAKVLCKADHAIADAQMAETFRLNASLIFGIFEQ